MKDRIYYEAESTHPRVSYAAHYENDGHPDDRAAAVAARAARAMREGDRHMDGSPRDHLPEGSRSGPDSMRRGFPAEHDPCRCGLPACRSGFPDPREIPPAREAREADAEPFEDFTKRASRQPELEAG